VGVGKAVVGSMVGTVVGVAEVGGNVVGIVLDFCVGLFVVVGFGV
jgi:hypothetical protein